MTGSVTSGLGPSQLAGVAHHEPEHRLLLIELRHRRQHRVRVGREEENRLRVAADRRGFDVLERSERVRHARVRREPLVVDVEGAVRPHHAVLDDRAVLVRISVTERRVEDLRLLLLAKVDQLRVAAVLKVGDAAVVPSVLVVAEEGAMRIGRERRLARSRKAEEEGAILRPLPSFAEQ